MSFQQRAMSCLLVLVLTGAISLVKAADTSLNTAHQAEPLLDADTGNHRLPKDVFPTKYTIRIEPNIVPDQFTFKGESEIEINIPRGTSAIVLHAVSLIFEEHHTELLYANASKVNVTMTAAYDEHMNFYKLNLSSSVPSGNYTLKMKYSGLLHADLRGFYRASSVNDQEKRVWFAATYFEPTYARRAFPCFDEPSFRATFKIFITHARNYTAISNMPVISKKKSDNSTKWITEFQETPMTSPHSVAFSVSDFEYLSSSEGSFRIFARNEKIHLFKFIRDMGPEILSKLANYTDNDYPLAKMDIFVAPQYHFLATENLGLIVFGENELSYDGNRTSTKAKHLIGQILSHELSHQWFGNLVTPSWWSFVWLNEGIATYFGFWITDQVVSSWRMTDQFVIETLQEGAFIIDDNEAQVPMDITTTLKDPDQIIEVAFNGVAYSKAGCVIRMFVHMLTPSVFQTGLQNYLKNKKYQSVTSGDLIRELAAVRQDIKFLDKALASWITQPGYPVITVIRNYTTGNAVISQKRFLTKSSKVRTEQWFVPINVISEEEPENFSETKPTHWLLNDTKTLTLSELKNASWIILNSQQTGYYRVNYDANNWQLIINYLKNAKTMKNIHVLNRAQLLDDSFHLAEAAELPDYSIFLKMTNYLQYEDDYIPWYAAHRAFAILNRALANTDRYNLYKLYIQRLTSKLETKLGYTEINNEKDDVKLNRLNVIKLACAMGSVKCLSAAHEMLIEHVVESKKISADLQSVVFCAGMRSTNKEDWETIYNYTIRLSKNAVEYQTLVNALGCSMDPEILKIYFEKALPKKSDVTFNAAFASIDNSDAAVVDAIFAVTKDRFQFIIDNQGPSTIENVLTNIASKMTTREQIKRLQDFIAALSIEHQKLAETLRSKAVNAANENIESVKKYERSVAKFLDTQNLREK